MPDRIAEMRRAMSALVDAADEAQRAAAADALVKVVAAFANEPRTEVETNLVGQLERDATALRMAGSRLNAMSDHDLRAFNHLLPWAAMTVDPKGRMVGQPYSAAKRTLAQELIDRRLVAFNGEFPLAGRTVLEVGCFEGIHTIGCLLLGAKVTGIDSRVENILKTLARLWAYEQQADLVLWNVEEGPPGDLPERWDVLHHIGVLYHLTKPVEHLNLLLPRTAEALILDTHVALGPEQAGDAYPVDGRSYQYWRYSEGDSATSPFAGMLDHAKWLLVEDLMGVVSANGFRDVRLVEDRNERNGRRVLIWAFR